MEEINHFSHKEHPLQLMKNWEMVVGVGDDDADDDGEKKGAVNCDGCQEPISISGGSAYGCVPCRYFLHKICADLIHTINHHYHPQHPLTLIARSATSNWYCDVCVHQLLEGGFSYKCSVCDFDACINCGVAIALKERLPIELKHEGHPQHTLTLQSRSASFLCDACLTKDEDLLYQCYSCDFWIHNTCTTLAPTINLTHHKHPLSLLYSLPDQFSKYRYYCEFCHKRVLKNGWMYCCSNCRYFAHIKCALIAGPSSIPRDVQAISFVGEDQEVDDLLHFPKPYAFTDPLKLLRSGNIPDQDDDDETTIEINHWSHHHPLILNVDHQDDDDDDGADEIQVCYSCVRPLSFPYYSCNDGCSFSLHKYCAELPLSLRHQLHRDHPLQLVIVTSKFSRCNGCFNLGNTYLYSCQICQFYLDVNCAFLPNTIKHELHNHPLIQVINPNRYCQVCDLRSGGISYACKACSYQLDAYCATRLPRSLGHRYCKGDKILLTYPPVEDHPRDLYCDICELEMHPKRLLYYCHKYKRSFHLDCLSRSDDFENTWMEGTITQSYHKHPLTFVRRIKDPRYVCSKCNGDINGFLILECRAKACDFNICLKCHYKIYDS